MAGFATFGPHAFARIPEQSDLEFPRVAGSLDEIDDIANGVNDLGINEDLQAQEAAMNDPAMLHAIADQIAQDEDEYEHEYEYGYDYDYNYEQEVEARHLSDQEAEDRDSDGLADSASEEDQIDKTCRVLSLQLISMALLPPYMGSCKTVCQARADALYLAINSVPNEWCHTGVREICLESDGKSVEPTLELMACTDCQDNTWEEVQKAWMCGPHGYSWSPTRSDFAHWLGLSGPGEEWGQSSGGATSLVFAAMSRLSDLFETVYKRCGPAHWLQSVSNIKQCSCRAKLVMVTYTDSRNRVSNRTSSNLCDVKDIKERFAIQGWVPEESRVLQENVYCTDPRQVCDCSFLQQVGSEPDAPLQFCKPRPDDGASTSSSWFDPSAMSYRSPEAFH
ncbi:hypothetical protein BCR37DRAFT_386999 [Protomyces lactucae-debilis]|uniref:Uncharacterized protein n=1 Tax=Protomyces lactucae-debilis TaxID=2754530 RepID=A0A1Y2FGQ5_PROLT|nr:uncharacterized protein BCR37DRAFT_386999 [Protomyces lactucae-debilis]ORY83128.1 hypothetical protein BCR37DRAFT_386999 [Protomyces lactucae-debilis]